MPIPPDPADLPILIANLDSLAIARNQCPKCGGPFHCLPCDEKVRDRVDEEIRKLREYYRQKEERNS